MTKRALLIVLAAVVLTGSPHLYDRGLRRGAVVDATASHEFRRTAHTDQSVEERLERDVAAMQEFRPGYEFWQHIYRIPDGAIAFGSAVDGRLLAVFPLGGNWARSAKWFDASLANVLDGLTLPTDLEERREFVAGVIERAAGPVLHNFTRGRFVAHQYAGFLAQWADIYERFGVPAEIGLAQALVESGFDGRRKSEANAVGLCQWLDRNWTHLDRIDPTVIESANQTTQAAYCAAYISILATKYGSFIPALSAHHAGDTNVGRVLLTGARLGAEAARERYFRGAELARELRAIGGRYSDIYATYGPRSYRYAEMIFGNTLTVRSLVAASRQQPIFAMRTNRAIPLNEIVARTGLPADEVKRYNPSLVKSVPAGATLYLPTYDRAFGRDVTFWARPASAAYAALLEEFVRIGASPEQWDHPSIQPVLKDFERRFRATGTEEGSIMATVLQYVRVDSLTSPRRTILAEYQESDEIRDLFQQGLHERESAAVLLAE